MKTIVSTEPVSLKIYDFPRNCEYVSWKISENNRNITFTFWCKNLPATIADGYTTNAPTREFEFDCAMTICIAINSSKENNFTLSSDPSIWGYSSKLSADGKRVLSSKRFNISNVSSGHICWGGLIRPVTHFYAESSKKQKTTIAGILNTFVSKTFNNDYHSFKEFYDGAMIAKQAKCFREKKATTHTVSTLFCSYYDAMICVDARYDKIAYFRLIAAGYSPISPENKHIIIMPIKKGTVTVDNVEYSGYLTPEDALGKQWFISETHNLIGQVGDS